MPEPPPTILPHGTTLQRARTIEANGPDTDHREPGSGHNSPPEGFSTVVGDGRPCSTGTPEMAARSKHALSPNVGGLAILEVSVPAWIMIRFEAESGLTELRAEWHNLPKRVNPL